MMMTWLARVQSQADRSEGEQRREPSRRIRRETPRRIIFVDENKTKIVIFHLTELEDNTETHAVHEVQTQKIKEAAHLCIGWIVDVQELIHGPMEPAHQEDAQRKAVRDEHE